MKKFTLSVLCAMGLTSAVFGQANLIHVAPATSALNGTSGNRGPNGTSAHTVMRAQYLVPASEMSAISTQTALTSFGFNLAAGATGGVPAVGNLTVYLVNTASTSYSMGTTWNPTGMTMVYAGTYSIPATAGTIDMTFTTSFNYTGGGLYVAYEYTGTTFATSPAIYNCISAATNQGATGASASTTPPATLGNTTFRPQYRFGYANPNSNDVAVEYILPTGTIPANTYTMHNIEAMVRNSSNTTLTNVAVGYSVSGVVNASTVVTIPSLSAGQSTVVAFPSYTVPTAGQNNYTVAVLPDQVNTNNMATATASFNCDRLGAGPGVTNFNSTAVGFNTGSGIIYQRFQVPVTSTLNAARIAISTGTANSGNQSWAVLSNSLGVSVATSQTVTLSPGMLGSYNSYTFTPQVLVPGVDYYLGVAQPSNATGYFPVAAFTVAVLPPNTYYTSALTATSVAALSANLGFIGIQAVLAGACGPVGIDNNTIVTDNISLYPNPAVNGKATVTGLEGVNKIVVYNMLGQIISSVSSDKEEVSIDLSNQVQGNYLVRITNSNNYTKTIKVINH